MAHLRRPSSISSSSISRATLIQDLYTAAYDAARLAVESDSSGAYTEAREAYIDAIQLLDRLLVQKQDPADEAERRMIVQKSAEYSNRAEQLYRYSFTAIISSHPDASQHAISHDRKSHKSIVETGRDKSSNIEDDYWEPKSEAAVLLEKAHFTLDQAVLNEEKEILDHSLELYKDAAENFLTAYRKLPKDDERCKICHELCMQAMNKVEELKRNSSTNGHFLSPPSRDSHHDTRSISSITSSVHSMTISNSEASDLGNAKCKTDENSVKKLSSAEIDLLKMTSNVNGKLFLPWMEEADLREKFTFSDSFVDPDGSLPLSALQRAKFGGWKRPCEIMRRPKMIELVSRQAPMR